MEDAFVDVVIDLDKALHEDSCNGTTLNPIRPPPVPDVLVAGRAMPNEVSSSTRNIGTALVVCSCCHHALCCVLAGKLRCAEPSV